MHANAVRLRARFVLVAFLFCLTAAACGGGETESRPRGEALDASARAISCEDEYTLDTPVGRLTNNVWNKQAIGGAPYTQCIRVRETPTGTEYGWSWSWPADSQTLLAFPETVIGWKPWLGGESTHPALPIRIDEIKLLRLSYTLQTAAGGQHNLATSLWLTRTGRTSIEPNPNDISTDLMIWTDHAGFSPLGEYLDNATIDGAAFELWLAKDLGDASGTAGPRWNYIAYRATEQSRSATLDLQRFLDDAVARGLVSPQHYVSNVETGNEVMSGAGETWIKALSLEVQ